MICQGGLRRPRGGHSVRAKLISVQGKSAAPARTSICISGVTCRPRLFTSALSSLFLHGLGGTNKQTKQKKKQHGKEFFFRSLALYSNVSALSGSNVHIFFPRAAAFNDPVVQQFSELYLRRWTPAEPPGMNNNYLENSVGHQKTAYLQLGLYRLPTKRWILQDLPTEAVVMMSFSHYCEKISVIFFFFAQLKSFNFTSFSHRWLPVILPLSFFHISWFLFPYFQQHSHCIQLTSQSHG